MGLDDVLNDIAGDPPEEAVDAEPIEQEPDEQEPIDEEIGKGAEDEEVPDDEESEEEGEEDEAEPEPRTIPLKAHREERQKLTTRAREAEAQVRQLQMQYAQMQAYLQAQQQQEQAQQQPPPPPTPQVEIEPPPEFKPSVSYDAEPAQYLREQNAHMQELLKHQQKAQAAQLEALKNETKADREAREKAEKEQLQQWEQQQQQQQWAQQIDSKILESEKRAAEDLPEYNDAVAYLYGVLHTQATAELKMLGVPEHEVPEMAKELLRQRTRNTAAHVLQRGGEPAEAVYRYALDFGFRPGKEDKLDRIERGKRSTGGPSQLSGAGSGKGKAAAGSGDFIMDAQRDAGLIR